MEMDLKEFGIIPIKIRPSTIDKDFIVVGKVRGKYFAFSVENEKEFFDNKDEFIKNTLSTLRQAKWK